MFMQIFSVDTDYRTIVLDIKTIMLMFLISQSLFIHIEVAIRQRNQSDCQIIPSFWRLF